MGAPKRIRTALVGVAMIALIAGATTLPSASLAADGSGGGNAAGSVRVGDIHVVKKIDRSSPTLF